MRPGVGRTVAVVVLCLDALLLGWTELAWLTLRVGTAPLPLSALVALVTTPLLVAGASAVAGGAGFPPLVVWTLTVGVAGFWGPAGIGVMPADWRAILLVAAGLLPGMVVAARRNARPRATRSVDAAAGA